MTDNPIKTLNNFEEYQAVTQSDSTYIIKLMGNWSNSYKRITEAYRVLANNSHIQFYELDINRVPKAVLKEQISAIPAFVLYHKSERVAIYIGVDEQKLYKMLQGYIVSLDNVVDKYNSR